MKPGGNKPNPQAGGGLSQMGGGFGESGMDENALQSALSQSGGDDSSAQPGGVSPTQQTGQGNSSPGGTTKPRIVGSFGEELVKRPFKDIAKGLISLFDINALLGSKPAEEDPAEKAKKQQIHSRFEQLTQEEQTYAQEKYQQEMQKKQQEEEERQAKKQQEERAKSQAIAPPSSPKKGPAQKGSGKAGAMQQLEDERTKIGNVQSAG
jgi:hypothetical protein